MGFSGLGGGLMVAAAAGLWLIYLLPTLFKRHNYLATERNAIRLAQTVRVLSETVDVPFEVRADVSPRVMAQQERKAREQHRKTIRPAVAAVPVIPFVEIGAGSRIQGSIDAEVRPTPVAERSLHRDPSAVTRRRLRRTRAIVTLITLAAVVTVLVQFVLIVATGVAAGAWGVIGFGGITAVTGVGSLARLARVSRRKAVVRPQLRKAGSSERPIIQKPVVQKAAEWTPVPIPKPMYLSRSEAPAAPIGDPVTELRMAAAESDEALRSVHAAPEVQPIRSTPPTGFAAMGIIDAAPTSNPDLDAVLRRRRSVG